MAVCKTCVATVLTVLWGLAAAATPIEPTSAQQLYEQERAACAAKSGDERRSCLKEASAALGEARHQTLDTQQPSPDNALRRCKMLPAVDRKDCEARMRSGTVSGSVQGGGMLRELVTPVPAAAPASR